MTDKQLADIGVTPQGYQAYQFTCYTCTIAIIGIVAIFVEVRCE